MKRITTLKFAGAALLFAGMMTFSSCDSDPCKDVTCVNGTATADGDNCECVCEDGYEGTQCDALIKTKFVGSYTVTEDCSNSAAATYTVTIGTDPNNIAGVVISGVWQQFTNSIKATVSGNTLTIASQEPDNDDFFISGSGTINETTNTLTVTYTVEDRTVTPTVSDVCTGSVWVK